MNWARLLAILAAAGFFSVATNAESTAISPKSVVYNATFTEVFGDFSGAVWGKTPESTAAKRPISARPMVKRVPASQAKSGFPNDYSSSAWGN